MKVKIVADQLCDSEVGLASAAHLVHRQIEQSRLPEFVALTKPRVMMLAVFTALVGLINAPVRLEPLRSPRAPAAPACSTCGTTPTLMPS